jgi:methionyl-tRNA formyltransferase
MTRVVVLGTYDADAPLLYQVDLMQYLAACGHQPSTIVFKTGSAPRPEIPLNTIHRLDETRTVVQVTDFNDPGAIPVLHDLQADIFVYAGGRDLLRPGVLDAARLGCLGGHYGPLPAIRGMGTVEWSVLFDQPIVVTIQRMAAGVDTGDVVLQVPVALRADDTFTSIRDRCYFWTKAMLAVATRAVLQATVTLVPQRAEDGEQHYRLHGDLIDRAARKLATRLQAYADHPWSHRG